MTHLNVGTEQLAARPALIDAIEVAWQRLASPGTWWSGAQRLAIVTQTRSARTCALCKQRKAALSPYSVDAAHEASDGLSADAIEAIHRVATDASRITESWVKQITSADLSLIHI